MASLTDTVGGVGSDLFDAPLSAGAAVAWALTVVVLGAGYCLAYAWLQDADETLPVALGWSFCAVLPWFVAFEGAKRRLIARAPAVSIAALFVGAAIVSLALERFVDRAVFDHATAPLSLQALRRVPAVAAAIALTVIAALRLRPVPGKPRNGVLPIPVESIDWIRAADNYLELHGGGRVVTCRMTMRQAETELAVAGFVRIHRSLLVRAARVAQVSGRGADAAVIMRDGAELPVGPSYRAAAGRLAG